MFVPSHVQDGDTKGSLATTLSVDLLHVTEPGHQLLTRDALSIVIFISLPNQPQLIGQQVGIRCQTSNTAHLIVKHN